MKYISRMKKIGFSSIFSSVNIPEDGEPFKENILKLGQAAKTNHLSLTIDISGDSIKKILFLFGNMKALTKIGIDRLRLDAGFSMKQAAEMSRIVKVALNASTLSSDDYAELKSAGAVFDNIVAWHNYYPRPETGLSKKFFLERNEYLRKLGFKVAAFVPGDGRLRGPIYKGLPTLERDRNRSTFISALKMKQRLSTDLVFIGDPQISLRTQRLFSNYLCEHKIVLRADLLDLKYSALILKTHHNRADQARDCLRSTESRQNVRFSVAPKNQGNRKKGTITIDNLLYKRYMGELQITKRDLPADKKVNIIGKIIDKDLKLIDLVGPNGAFKIIENRGGSE
ncbi:MupG family TIM beta-alpha barrel fold protein [Oenococcus alcoholitolerans]|uniref:MupG family TIM beta-alpha barrel fold protein n=1 Tax=Oenococcus alcoholitolerans TaxID=931074 RepID=UPI003F6F315E